ncbi:hypothetical protein [uncultured Jatrophihabitans sp.]|uniref:hypothetical protein n=1 Tax=uncultured Jatrophihabitans sp. TaxID=1610747 RepID=UPI0035CC74B2
MADDTTDLPEEQLDSVEAEGVEFRGVDFEESDFDDADLDEQFLPPPDRSREAALIAAGLSVVAAVLCVVAPFRAVYTLRAQGISASFDGWGRYDLASGAQHGPRYGVALTVAALVLVIAAATRLRDLHPVAETTEAAQFTQAIDAIDATDAIDAAFTGDDRLAAGVGIAGSALLLGVLASVALSIESTVSNADSIAATGGTATTVDVGAMLWLLVGAWVVSVVAVYLPWFEARRRT